MSQIVGWDEYTSDPEYQNLSRAEKVGMFKEWQKYAQNAMSEMGALSEQDDIDYFNQYGEEATKGILGDMGLPEALSNAFNRGMLQAKQNLAMGLATAGVSPEEQAAKLAELEKEKDNYPASWNLIETTKTDPKADKLDQATSYLKKSIQNPGTLAETLVESLASQFGTQAGIAPEFIGAGALATAATGPGAAAGAAGGFILSTGAASFANEYTSKFISTLRDQGVDVEDPKAMTEVFESPEKMKLAKEKAMAKGVPVAVFDTLSAALSFGIGAKVASGVVRGGAVKTLEKTAEGALKESAKQIVKPMSERQAFGLTTLAFGGDVALGMAGEATGQKFSEGQITDVPGVVAEGLVELVPGMFEFGAGAVKGIVSPTFVPTTEANLKAQQALQNIENRKVLAEAQKLQVVGAPETAKAVASTGVQQAVSEVVAPANEPQVGEVAPITDNPEQSVILLNELSEKLKKGETPLLSDETQKQTFQKLAQTAPDKFRFESGPEGIKVLEVPGATQTPAPTAPAPQPEAPQQGQAAVAPALTQEPIATPELKAQETPITVEPITVTEGDFTFDYDPQTLQTYYGGQVNPETRQDLQDLGTALAINLDAAYKGLGAGFRNKALRFNTIKVQNVNFGGGVYADPSNEAEFNTLYVDPNRLLAQLKSTEKKKGTAASSQFLVDALTEEALHVQDGASLYSNFNAKTQKGEDLRGRFGDFKTYYKAFFSRVTEEMSPEDIDNTLKAYLGRRWSNRPEDQRMAVVSNPSKLSSAIGMPAWKVGAEFSRQVAQEGLGRKTEDLWAKPRPFLYSLLDLYKKYYNKLVGAAPGKRTRGSGVEIIARRYKNLNDILASAPEDLRKTVNQGDYLSSFDPTAFSMEEDRIQSENEVADQEALDRAERWLSNDPTNGYRKYALSIVNQNAMGLRSKSEYTSSMYKAGGEKPLDEIQVDALTELSRLATAYDPTQRPENVDPRQHEMGFIRAGLTNFLLARKKTAGIESGRNLSLDIPLPKGVKAAGRGVLPKAETKTFTTQEKAEADTLREARQAAMRDKTKAEQLKALQTDQMVEDLTAEPEDKTGADNLVEEVDKELEDVSANEEEILPEEGQAQSQKEEEPKTGLSAEVEKQGAAMLGMTAKDNPAQDAVNDAIYDNEGEGPQVVGDTTANEDSSTEADIKRRERESMVEMLLNRMDPKLRSVYDLELEAMANNPKATRDTLDKYGAKKLGITEDEYAELRQETFKNFRSQALSKGVGKDDLVGSPNPDDVIADLSQDGAFYKWSRKWFSSRGLLPQVLFDTWVKAQQSEAGEYYQARQNATEMRDILKGIQKSGGDMEKARNLVNTVLSNPNEGLKLKAREELMGIDPKLHDLTVEMRDHIDQLSLELANLMHVPEKLRGTVLANLRTYLNRSYEIFDNPEWAKNLVQAINAPQGSKVVNDNAQQIINAARVWASNDLQSTRARRDTVKSLRKENQLRRKLGLPRYQDEWATRFNALNPDAKIDFTTKEGKKLADEKYRESADFKAKYNANLQKQNPITVGEANRYLTKIIDQYRQPDIQALVRGKGNVFRKNLDILKYRENIPEELRKLLGEYTDPDAVYFRTAQKLSSFLAKDKFLSDFAELGKGVTDENGVQISQKFLYEKESELPANGDYVKFRADNPSYAPLDGKWMPRELADVLAEHFKPEEVSEKWFGIFRKATGLAMLAKTGYSFQATIRNFLGNIMQPFSNGHVYRSSSWRDAFANPKVLKEAAVRSDNPILDALRNKAKDEKAWSQEIKKLISYGIIGENIDSNLIKEFLRQDTFISSGEKFLNSGIQKGKLIANGLKEFNTLVNRNYASVDHFWKVLFFEADKSRYGEIFPGAPENLIEEYAARVVRDTTFTYSMSPKSIRALSRTGVLAPFVRFSSEVIRTVANQIQLAKEEITGDTTNVPNALLKYLDRSKMRKSGWQRFLGLSTTFVLLPGAVTAIGMTLGIDKDDEDKIRRYLPSYWKNAQIAVIGKNNKGEYKYLNLSFINPYAYFAEVKNSIFTSEGDIKDRMAGVLGAAFKPFVSEQLLVGALMDVARNRTADGKEIYNPRDPDASEKILAHVAQPFVPGTAQSIGRIVEGYKGEVRDSGYAPSFGAEFWSTFTGTKISQGNVVEGWDRKIRGFKKMESDTEQMFTKVLGSRGTVTPERLTEAYDKMEQARYQLWQEFRADYEAARGLGLDIGQAVSLLKANKVSDDTIRAVVAGRYIPYRAGKVLLQNSVRYPGGTERLRTYLTQITQEAAKRSRLITTKLPD